MKSSASHDSVIDNRLQSNPNYHHHHPHAAYQLPHYDQFAHPHNQNLHDNYRHKDQKHSHGTEKGKDYGVIPAPMKTAKKAVVRTSTRLSDHRNRSKNTQHDSAENYGYPPPFRAYPPHPFQDGNEKSSRRLSAALQHGYMEREDER